MGKYHALTGILIFLAVQAVIGVFALEYALRRLKRFREKDEDRDSPVPYFRRLDSDYWARWKFYPGAMLWMPTRMVLMCLDAWLLTVVGTILSCGHDYQK